MLTLKMNFLYATRTSRGWWPDIVGLALIYLRPFLSSREWRLSQLENARPMQARNFVDFVSKRGTLESKQSLISDGRQPVLPHSYGCMWTWYRRITSVSHWFGPEKTDHSGRLILANSIGWFATAVLSEWQYWISLQAKEAFEDSHVAQLCERFGVLTRDCSHATISPPCLNPWQEKTCNQRLLTH